MKARSRLATVDAVRNTGSVDEMFDVPGGTLIARPGDWVLRYPDGRIEVATQLSFEELWDLEVDPDAKPQIPVLGATVHYRSKVGDQWYAAIVVRTPASTDPEAVQRAFSDPMRPRPPGFAGVIGGTHIDLFVFGLFQPFYEYSVPHGGPDEHGVWRWAGAPSD